MIQLYPLASFDQTLQEGKIGKNFTNEDGKIRGKLIEVFRTHNDTLVGKFKSHWTGKAFFYKMKGLQQDYHNFTIADVKRQPSTFEMVISKDKKIAGLLTTVFQTFHPTKGNTWNTLVQTAELGVQHVALDDLRPDTKRQTEIVEYTLNNLPEKYTEPKFNIGDIVHDGEFYVIGKLLKITHGHSNNWAEVQFSSKQINTMALEKLQKLEPTKPMKLEKGMQFDFKYEWERGETPLTLTDVIALGGDLFKIQFTDAEDVPDSATVNIHQLKPYIEEIKILEVGTPVRCVENNNGDEKFNGVVTALVYPGAPGYNPDVQKVQVQFNCTTCPVVVPISTIEVVESHKGKPPIPGWYHAGFYDLIYDEQASYHWWDGKDWSHYVKESATAEIAGLRAVMKLACHISENIVWGKRVG